MADFGASYGEMGEALRGMMQAIQDLDQQLAGG